MSCTHRVQLMNGLSLFSLRWHYPYQVIWVRAALRPISANFAPAPLFCIFIILLYKPFVKANSVYILPPCTAVFRIAFTAIHRSVLLRLKRYCCYSATSCAYHFKYFTLTALFLLSRTAAFYAPLRLVFKSALCVKLLLADSEYKLTSAVAAYNRLILVHNNPL